MLQQYVLYPAICAVSIEFHIAEKYISSLFMEINPLSARNLMQSMEYDIKWIHAHVTTFHLASAITDKTQVPCCGTEMILLHGIICEWLSQFLDALYHAVHFLAPFGWLDPRSIVMVRVLEIVRSFRRWSWIIVRLSHSYRKKSLLQ